jgi:hypothetical protein
VNAKGADDFPTFVDANVVDDRSCLPTRATWRGMRFRFGGGLVYGAARRTRGADEAPHTIEQLQGDFAGLPLM